MDGSDILHELEGTEFSQKLRGYDPAQVDALIDRATREIVDLRAERRAALDRAEMAEKRIDQELDATQRARATAEAEIATAEAEGRRTVAEAESEAATLRAAAETEVRAAIEKARQRMIDETTSLEVTRDAVRDDISIMERHIDAHRERLLGSLSDLRKLVEAVPARPLAENAVVCTHR
jgi:DivIVA domain-containing protein